MKTTYSKSMADIAVETSRYADESEQTLLHQRAALRSLETAPFRKRCLLCNADLIHAGSFLHRGMVFLFCAQCGHVQSRALPPEGYPQRQRNSGFNQTYPELSPEDYASRCRRIYSPKIEWALSCAEASGISPNQLRAGSWLELGCGAGYLLSAMLQAEIRNVVGFEADRELVLRANRMLKRPVVVHNDGPLDQVIYCNSADVYASIFVFEHLENPQPVFRALREKPAGTILLFSVPVFGISSLLDNLFEDRHARMLDGVVHTQLYTDESIAFVLNSIGFNKLGEWVFGADAAALHAALSERLIRAFPAEHAASYGDRLALLVDPIQQAIDRLHLADERHIFAVKQ